MILNYFAFIYILLILSLLNRWNNKYRNYRIKSRINKTIYCLIETKESKKFNY